MKRPLSPHPASVRIFSYGLAEMCEARIPLRFRTDDGHLDLCGETIGIAPTHLILTSPVQLEDGMRLRLHLRLATDPSANEFGEIELFAWVLSTSKLPDGQFGAQVELERH